MSIRRTVLALVCVAGLLLILSIPAAARQTPLHRPQPGVSSRHVPNGRQPRVRPAGFTNSSQPRDLVSHGGFVWFDATAGAGYSLFKSNTFSTTSIYDNIDPRELVWAGNKLFFVAEDSTHGYELWVSDGTHGGTHYVKDVVTGTGSPDISYITAVGNKVYYELNDGVHGYEPWVSDGTPGGTHALKEIEPGPDSSYPYGFTAIGSKVVFEAGNDSHGYELWVTDGTAAGTKLLKDIQPGTDSSDPYQFTRIGSRLVFTADDGTHGYEPWSTDGTKAGTKLLKDIAPGTSNSYPNVNDAIFTTFNGFVFFTANDGVHGAELWKTDGTSAHTKLADDMRPGARAGNPYEADATSNALYLVAEDGSHGYELWKSDGTKSGTAMLKDIWPGFQSSYPYLDGYDSSPLGTKLIFVADDGSHGYEPWVTNGTQAGTKLVKDILAGSESSGPSNFVTVATGTIRGTVVFFDAENNATGNELWFTDGTPSGTHVIDVYPGP